MPGNLLGATVPVNEAALPSGQTWQNVGVFTLGATTTTMCVQLTNVANGTVVADAVEVVPVQGTIQEIGPSGLQPSTSWTPTAGSGYDGNKYYLAAGVSGSPTATAAWSFGGVLPGQQYEVLVSGVASGITGEATNAPFSVYNDSVSSNNLLGTTAVNESAGIPPGASGKASALSSTAERRTPWLSS